MRWKITIEGTDETAAGRSFAIETDRTFYDLPDVRAGLSIEDGTGTYHPARRLIDAACPVVGEHATASAA